MIKEISAKIDIGSIMKTMTSLELIPDEDEGGTGLSMELVLKSINVEVDVLLAEMLYIEQVLFNTVSFIS